MKPMTFEEWDNVTFVKNIAKFDEDQRRACFNAARQGMIPKDEAVRIPLVSEWPEAANSAILCYSTNRSEGQNMIDNWGFIAHISRPAPQWTPKISDFVYTKNGDKVEFGQVYDIDETWINVRLVSGDCGGWDIDQVKPGNLEHFGKPWDEIPKGGSS